LQRERAGARAAERLIGMALRLHEGGDPEYGDDRRAE